MFPVKFNAMNKFEKSSDEILINYKMLIIKILKETDISVEEKQSINAKTGIESVNLYIKTELQRFCEDLKIHGESFRDVLERETEIALLNEYKNKIIIVLKSDGASYSEILKLKKLKTKHAVENYCKIKFRAILPLLVKNGFNEFKEVRENKLRPKNNFKQWIKIIYNPMGNKR